MGCGGRAPAERLMPQADFDWRLLMKSWIILSLLGAVLLLPACSDAAGPAGGAAARGERAAAGGEGPDGPTAAWGRALEACALVTRERFDEGRAVCAGVSGRLRFELRLTWLGGRRILEQVERRSSDLLHHRPAFGAGDVPLLLWRAVRWGRGVA